MDFFGHQDAARRKTIVLIAYFIGAVVLIIAAIYAAAILIFSYLQTQSIGEPRAPAALWNAEVFGWVVVISHAVIVGGSLFKMAGFSVVEKRAFQESRLEDIEMIDNRPDQMFFLEAVK